MWSKRNASALVRPCHADAQSASLRENRLSRHLQHFPARPSVPGLPHAEGRAPHARTDDSRFTEAWPRSATGPSFAPDDYVTPRLASGLAMRTHRVRPSEKIASRVISSTSPQGHPSSDCPPLEGRAPHARTDDSRFTEAWPRSTTGPSFAPNDYVMPRLASGLAMRTRRPRPSEKTASRVNPGPSSARPSHPRLGPPAEGRAPHARYETITLTPTLPPFGNWPLAHLSVTVTHPGLHPAFHLPCSGTHRPKNRLPEKLPPRHASSHCP